MNTAYIGHDSQLHGIEEVRLVGGKGDGMRLLQVRNGLGLEFTVVADRCCDISRLSFRGNNYCFFSPAGYVAPAFYDSQKSAWLRSFTAGFLTTCGLTAVGDPEVCDGEELPLHGRIANEPAEQVCWYEEDDKLIIRGRMAQSYPLGEKLVMYRKYEISLTKNEFTVTDTIENQDAKTSPLMILYHMNMGYPLLSETAELVIPAKSVEGREEFAKAGIDHWNEIVPPQPGIAEQCYYHHFEKDGVAALYNPAIGSGVEIRFDAENLDYFTQWKMMGQRDYVMGLEPGNCSPDGRTAMRESGGLKYLAPGEKKTYQVRVSMVENEADWQARKAVYGK